MKFFEKKKDTEQSVKIYRVVSFYSVWNQLILYDLEIFYTSGKTEISIQHLWSPSRYIVISHHFI